MISPEERNSSSAKAIKEHLNRCGGGTQDEQILAVLNLGSTIGLALVAMFGKEGAVEALEKIIEHVQSDNYTITQTKVH